MIRLQIIFLLFILPQIAYTQSQKYNLDFENIDKQNFSNWNILGEFILIRDSITVNSGRYSALIADSTNSGILGIRNIIKGSFNGSKITLEGYIKTENAKNAYAFLIVGQKNNPFHYHMGKSLHGNNEWTKFQITLPFSEEVTRITVAGNLEGSGRVWFDNFLVKIDGVTIEDLKGIQKSEKIQSHFNINHISRFEINNLVLLGKIWGFLKYYHPNIRNGKANWDKELFDILPLVKKESFQEGILKWIKNFNSPDFENRSYGDDNIFLHADLKWISDKKNLNIPLIAELEKIRDAVRPDENYYVTMVENTGQIEFQNENIYSQMSYEDDGMKLLALFRFWNVVQYFYPYRNLISKNWDTVLAEFIPKMIKANTALDYRLTLLELVGRIEDTHSTIYSDTYLNKYFGKRKPPFKAKFINEKLVITNRFNNSPKIQEGDIIYKINGVPVSKKKKELYKYSMASNYSTTLRNLSHKIIRTNKDTITLEIKRSEQKFIVTVPTMPLFKKLSIEKSEFEIKEEYAYLNTDFLGIEDYNKIWPKIMNKKGIIIDLRVYPDINLPHYLAPYFFKKPFVFYTSTRGSLKFPGRFFYNKKEVIRDNNPCNYDGKIVILVNESTQSLAEFSALAFMQFPNATIIGSQTAGTDGAASSFIFPGNVKTFITTTGIYNLDKSNTQKVGIPIDVLVRETIKSIKKDKDKTLMKAINIILDK